MTQELLGDLLRRASINNPSRVALIWRDQEYSYITLDAQVDQVAHGLRKMGVGPRDRIALYMHNVPQFIICLYAIQRVGAVAVPVNIYWKDRDLIYLLNESRVSGVITIAPLYDRIQQALLVLPEIQWVVAITSQGATQPDGSLSWLDLLVESNTDLVTSELLPDEPALISFTAGRTGPSRAVLLSHNNLLTNCQQMVNLQRVNFYHNQSSSSDTAEDLLDDVPGITHHEITLLPMQLFNLFSLNTGLNLTYLLSGTVILMEKFDPTAALHLIDTYGCTLMFGTPTIFTELTNAPEFAKSSLKSLRYSFSYGGPLATQSEDKWRAKLRQPIYNCYGITEASPVICCEAGGEQITPDSVGPALSDVEICIVNNEMQQVEAEQVGEIFVRGPNLMIGYFNPEAPDEPFIGKNEGWFRTGDLGLFEANGNYHILDRREDALVLKKGELLLPSDVEKVLNNHPGVWQSCALPYTTPGGRAQMVAFVIPNDAGRNLHEAQLMHYCTRHLPALHIPERIFAFRESDFPRLPNGIVWRRALKLHIPHYYT